MNDRQKRIVKLLNATQEWKTGKELSQIMEVSDRTIRSDIEAINRYYGQKTIESSIKQGYRINEDTLPSFCEEMKSCIPQTSQERCNYIIRELLTNKKEINLLDLQNEVYISGYTIDNDLKKIRNIIKPYDDLHIVRSKNFISLKGPEKSKRLLYKDLLAEETDGSFSNLNNIASLFKDFDLLKVKETFEKTLQKYNYHIRESSMPMVLIHVGVSIERMLHQNYIPQGADNVLDLQDSIEFKIVDEFYQKIANRIFIQPKINEVQLLALLLMGKKSEEYTSNEIVLNNRQFLVSDIVHEILEDIYTAYDIDFRKDKDLFNGLSLHVRSLLHRISCGESIQNVYLEEIKLKYPLVLDMSVHACRTLGRLTGVEIAESEIGFIALHLGNSYEKIRFSNKYQALLIFPKDLPLSSLCFQKIETRFGDRMEIADQVYFYDEKEVRELSPDLILTSLPLKHGLDIPTVQISLLIDTEDESRIFQTLNLLDKKKKMHQFETSFRNIFKPDLFFKNMEENTPEDIIRKMCEHMEDNGYVDSKYVDSVLQREAISSTSFYNGFALPHALNYPAIQSCITVAMLDEAIQWHDYKVRLVILLAINYEDRDLMSIFFDGISGIVTDSAKFSKLLNIETYDEFVELILKG